MESSLVERARSGDVDAFEELVRGRIDDVFRVALTILSNPSDARDATQEAFVAVWRSLPSLRDPDRFDPWLRQITVNSARMTLRRRRRVREIALPADVDPDGLGRPLMGQGDVAATDFDRAFERLSVDQRALLAAHHLDGRSVAGLAGELGIPAGTVKSRLHAARAALQRALAEVRR
jgi:RNA polymerase sigma-70 factor, ECF subfamily